MISIYNYKQRNVIIIAILLILSTVILYSVRGIAGALLSTVVLYTILRPVFLFLVYQWNWKRWIAALFIMLSSFVMIVLPFFAFPLLGPPHFQWLPQESHMDASHVLLRSSYSEEFSWTEWNIRKASMHLGLKRNFQHCIGLASCFLLRNITRLPYKETPSHRHYRLIWIAMLITALITAQALSLRTYFLDLERKIQDL